MGFLLLLASVLVALTPVPEGEHQSKQATPNRCSSAGAATAADAIAASFDNHQFVFIGMTHGDAKIEEFLMCLVTRPAFKERVTDILVESASSGHQSLLDRYELTLDKLTADELAPIWFDTDAPTLW